MQHVGVEIEIRSLSLYVLINGCTDTKTENETPV